MRNFKKTQKKLPTLRRSQTVTTFGVGAIADLPDASVMICGIDKWDVAGTIPLNDPRLEKKLSVACFRMAPDADSPTGGGILAVRFPRYLRCRKCNGLKTLEAWRLSAQKTQRFNIFDDRPYCAECSVTLIPSRFVVACRKGHIDDFPYIEWAHFGKEPCSNPSLKYNETSSTAGLSGIYIKCISCGSGKNMGNAFDKKAVARVAQCKGAMPWEMIWFSECGDELTTLQRGGTNVHFPILKSSILIPPYKADSLKTRIMASPYWAAYESQQNAADLEFLINPIANFVGEPVDKVSEVVKEIIGNAENDTQDTKDEEDYRYEEYRAFLGDFDQEANDSRDFLIEQQDINQYDVPLISSIVLVKKLREVRVQTGFSRIKPPQVGSDENPVSDAERIEPMPVTQNRRQRWYPGYEVRGEGIFLEFDSKLLSEWSKNGEVQKHFQKLLERSRRYPDSFGLVSELTPEFIFIHTLSHILIRQLSFECGYSSSSLRERIYCSSTTSGNKMFGLLIYTAEGDSDGTLGGLVRQGEADLFSDTFKKSISETKWCSSDPLCIESDGQGYLALNLGACHSCCMLPETSCEGMNRYLDRAALVGTLSEPQIGLFSDELNRLQGQLG